MLCTTPACFSTFFWSAMVPTSPYSSWKFLIFCILRKSKVLLPVWISTPQQWIFGHLQSPDMAHYSPEHVTVREKIHCQLTKCETKVLKFFCIWQFLLPEWFLIPCYNRLVPSLQVPIENNKSYKKPYENTVWIENRRLSCDLL